MIDCKLVDDLKDCMKALVVRMLQKDQRRMKKIRSERLTNNRFFQKQLSAMNKWQQSLIAFE